MKMTHTAALACVLTGSAVAQDMLICIEPISSTRGRITAEYRGQLPAGTTAIGTVWSNTVFTLSSNSPIPISITDWNDGYNTSVFGGPTITGNGTSTVSFAGFMPPAPLGNPDASNPLLVVEFDFAPRNSLIRMSLQLTGQNSAVFVGNPDEPFGTILLYQDSAGNPGPLGVRVRSKYPPAPGTLAVAPIALVATRRRRK